MRRSGVSFEIVWEFEVRPEAVDRFIAAYGPEGEWVALFRSHPGYLGTTLLQDAAAPHRFLTIDRWTSESAFDGMRQSAGEAYARLDTACEGLTVAERPLGVFRARVAERVGDHPGGGGNPDGAD